MLHLAFEKVGIYLWKIGSVNCKWSNLNVPGSYTDTGKFLQGLCRQDREVSEVRLYRKVLECKYTLNLTHIYLTPISLSTYIR